MRRYWTWIPLAAAAGLVLGLLDGRGRDVPAEVLAAPAQSSGLVYLPMGLKAQAMADLPPAPTALPVQPTEPPPAATATPVGPTEAPSATPTVPPPASPTVATVEPPTATPTTWIAPTATATPTLKPTVVAGAIKGRLVVDGDPAPLGLGEEVGPGLVLRACSDERTCTVVARTGVADDDGNFVFANPPALDAGRYYQVTWINENPEDSAASPYAGADLWMGVWYGAPIRGYQPGQTVDVGEVEIGDIVLVSPTHGSGFGGLPWTFTWQARKHETGVYSWAICLRCCQTLAQRIGHYHTSPLGRRTSYTVSQYPPGTQIGIDYKYCWFVRSEAPDGSIGESYHVRMLWWMGLALLGGR
ncbi:hypothetical protein DCC79_09865 [bacterium]|nr:MAG: hypothetical protein DCC79_09865 [bacterium]